MTTKTGSGARRAIRATAFAVVVVMVSVSVPAAPAGSVEPTLFQRSDWSRNGAKVMTLGGVQMRTRGFFPDGCVLAPLPCLTQPEDTATTHVIRALVLRHPSLPAPQVPPDPIGAVVQLFDKVHWQVGPSGGWRTDVLVDDGAAPTILEVKRWGSATTTPVQVDKQLNNPTPALGEEYGYIQKFANDVGLTVRRNDELNIEDWLHAYLDDGFGISCVWADPDELAHPGNIYYAPILQAPPNIQNRCALETLGKVILFGGIKLAVQLVTAYALGGRPATLADAIAACARHELLDRGSRACACEGGVTDDPGLLGTAQTADTSTINASRPTESTGPAPPSAMPVP